MSIEKLQINDMNDQITGEFDFSQWKLEKLLVFNSSLAPYSFKLPKGNKLSFYQFNNCEHYPENLSMIRLISTFNELNSNSKIYFYLKTNVLELPSISEEMINQLESKKFKEFNDGLKKCLCGLEGMKLRNGPFRNDNGISIKVWP